MCLHTAQMWANCSTTQHNMYRVNLFATVTLNDAEFEQTGCWSGVLTQERSTLRRASGAHCVFLVAKAQEVSRLCQLARACNLITSAKG